jgi:prepilin-type N-terminal cleavage/methylation domain-containing protein
MLQARRAFTLIEVIAALAIIGLGLVGILSLFPVGIDASKRAGDLTNATILGQSVLDQIRAAANRGDLTLTNAKTLFQTSGTDTFKDFDTKMSNIIGLVDDRQPFIPKVQTASGEHTLYQYQVKFDDPPTEEKLDDLKDVGLQKVTLTVSWPANEPKAGLRNRVTLVTFIKFPETR